MDRDQLNNTRSGERTQVVTSVTPVDSPYKVGPGERPMMQQVTMDVPVKQENSKLFLLIGLITASLVALTFVGLFVWMMMEKNEAESDVNGKIAMAVADAKDEQRQEDYAVFEEQEKSPYKVFAGPRDYGELTFEYPKTWSVYVGEDASNSGGNYVTYFNPNQVQPVGANTANALRVSILASNFATVAQGYQKVINDGKTDLTMQSVTIGKDDNITANLYSGQIPSSTLRGYIIVFKIRDKTAVLQTDSAEQYLDDFNRVLDTLTFNE